MQQRERDMQAAMHDMERAMEEQARQSGQHGSQGHAWDPAHRVPQTSRGESDCHVECDFCRQCDHCAEHPQASDAPSARGRDRGDEGDRAGSPFHGQERDASAPRAPREPRAPRAPRAPRTPKEPCAPQQPHEPKAKRTTGPGSGGACCNCDAEKADLAGSRSDAPHSLLKEHLHALEGLQQLQELDSLKDLKKLIRKAEKDAMQTSKEISKFEQSQQDEATLGLAGWTLSIHSDEGQPDSQGCPDATPPSVSWTPSQQAQAALDVEDCCLEANPISKRSSAPTHALPFGPTPSPAPQAWLKAISEQDWNELLPAQAFEALAAPSPELPLAAGSPWPSPKHLAELPSAPPAPRATPSAWPQPTAESTTLEEIRRLMQEMRAEMREVRSSLSELRGEVRELR